LGVDKSTVSLALRDHPSISGATKARVIRAAEEMGYRPDALNALLTSLRWQRDGHRQYVHLAFLRSTPTMLREKCNLVLRGASRRAEELGIAVSDFALCDYPDLRSLARVLEARGVRGVLVGPNGPDIDWTVVDWSPFAVINAGLGFTAPEAHAVITDYFASVNMAWDHLREKGHRRIGFALQAYLNNEIDHRRVAAAQHILRYRTKPADRVPLLVHHYYDPPPFLNWFAKHTPEAVITSTPTPVQWLEESGQTLEGQVEVAAVETHLDPASPAPPAPGVSEALERIGRRAVDLLLLMLRDGERGLPASPESIVIPPLWIPGNRAGRTRTTKGT
jgi:LacI family transcriptional regulator